MRQADLFMSDVQPEGFEDAPARTYKADPDEVRADLQRMLAEARAANVIPWDRDTASLYRTIFPQMSRWLPDEEAAQLCLEFEAELLRLKAA